MVEMSTEAEWTPVLLMALVRQMVRLQEPEILREPGLQPDIHSTILFFVHAQFFAPQQIDPDILHPADN